MVRRVFDIVGAAVMLVLTAPLLLVVAAAVRVVDGSPVLFRHRRCGRGGRPFTMVKFRTMRLATDTEHGPEHDVLRRTRLGTLLRSTSLDELPTLLNVLHGDMSIVGPRPWPVTYLTRYDDRQARRLEVRPGITGWAVVSGRNQLSWNDRVALDVWYVEHRSWRLDARILARTPRLVMRRIGIDHGVDVTMTEFLGPGS